MPATTSWLRILPVINAINRVWVCQWMKSQHLQVFIQQDQEASILQGSSEKEVRTAAELIKQLKNPKYIRGFFSLSSRNTFSQILMAGREKSLSSFLDFYSLSSWANSHFFFREYNLQWCPWEFWWWILRIKTSQFNENLQRKWKFGTQNPSWRKSQTSCGFTGSPVATGIFYRKFPAAAIPNLSELVTKS